MHSNQAVVWRVSYTVETLFTVGRPEDRLNDDASGPNPLLPGSKGLPIASGRMRQGKDRTAWLQQVAATCCLHS